MNTQQTNPEPYNATAHDQLVEQMRQGSARLVVNQMNHREFVMNGTRYFCGYSSQRDTRYKGPKTWTDPEYKVQGWLMYKTQPEFPTS